MTAGYVWRWAKRNKPFWGNLLLLVLTPLIVWLVPGGERSRDEVMRGWGLLLQFIGIGTVWFDYTSAARKFRKEGLIASTFTWLKSLWSSNSMATVLTSSASLSAHATGRVRRYPKPDDALPDRVAKVEYNLNEIDKELDLHDKELQAHVRETKSSIRDEVAARTAAVDEVKKLVGETATDNYPLLVFGVVWLVVGLTLATMSTEFACWCVAFHRQG